jgi:hypothetical protein
MTLEIPVPGQTCGGLKPVKAIPASPILSTGSLLKESQPSPPDNWISKSITDINKR